MSPLPDIRQMAREPSGDDEQGVDPDIVTVAHIAWSEPLRGDSDPAQAVAVERPGRRFFRSAGFHFHKGEGSAAPGDDVDFTARNPRPPRQDSLAFQPQIPAGEGFGAAASLLRFLALHLEESSSARA